MQYEKVLGAALMLNTSMRNFPVSEIINLYAFIVDSFVWETCSIAVF